jgi:hypothetical protein
MRQGFASIHAPNGSHSSLLIENEKWLVGNIGNIKSRLWGTYLLTLLASAEKPTPMKECLTELNLFVSDKKPRIRSMLRQAASPTSLFPNRPMTISNTILRVQVLLLPFLTRYGLRFGLNIAGAWTEF